MKELVLKLIFLLGISGIYCGQSDICPTFVSRKQWGARAPEAVDYLTVPVKYVIVHHTVTPTCSDENRCSDLLTNIQNYHMDTQKFHDIGYNFIICGDGKVYEGVGWHKVGAHTKNYNSKAIGLAFMGNFTSTLPNEKQLQAGKDFLKCGIQLGELDSRYKLFGARTVSATQSPGLALYRELQSWLGFCNRKP